jgi:virginiamycin B lyase
MVLAALAASSVVAGLSALATPTPSWASSFQVSEFRIPGSGAGPTSITVGPDGAIWFTNLVADSVGRFAGGAFTLFPLPTRAYPESIVTGPDGALWFTDEENSVIWRITTAGRFSSFTVPPCSGCAYSGGSGVGNIVVGPDGALWYARGGNVAIGRITTAGAVHEFPVSDYPSWVSSGPDGAIWFAVSNGIARMTTNGSVSLVWDKLNYPSSIIAGPDGNLWFTGFYQDVVGTLSPSTRTAHVYQLATGCAPEDITADTRSMWLTCSGLSLVYRVSLSGRRTAITIPSQNDDLMGVVRAGSATWFTEEATSRLGNVTG